MQGLISVQVTIKIWKTVLAAYADLCLHLWKGTIESFHMVLPLTRHHCSIHYQSNHMGLGQASCSNAMVLICGQIAHK